MNIADVIQIIIGILSLIATVGVSFAIYWLQSRHEKEMEDLAKEKEKKLLKEEADKFLIDNESERDYLPLCVFASNLHRHEKHTRKIYTNFCRCRTELQNKILEVAEFKCRTIDGVDWLDKAIDKFKDDIQKFHLEIPDRILKFSHLTCHALPFKISNTDFISRAYGMQSTTLIRYVRSATPKGSISFVILGKPFSTAKQ